MKVQRNQASLTTADTLNNFLSLAISLVVTFQVITGFLVTQFSISENFIDRNVTDLDKSLEYYVTALYSLVVTVTTVGYGDLIPTKWDTMLTTIALQLCGIIFFGFMMTKVR